MMGWEEDENPCNGENALCLDCFYIGCQVVTPFHSLQNAIIGGNSVKDMWDGSVLFITTAHEFIIISK